MELLIAEALFRGANYCYMIHKWLTLRRGPKVQRRVIKRVLERMCADGLVEFVGEEPTPQGPRRKIHRLTEDGRNYLHRLTRFYVRLVFDEMPRPRRRTMTRSVHDRRTGKRVRITL